MNEEQAQEVVLLIRAATGGRVEENTVNYFTAAMQVLDYDLALAAATVGTITWRRFPSWAEFKEVYRAQKRLAEPVGEQRQDLPLGGREEPSQKRGVAAPEWVWVWSWARLFREPTEQRMFPQQEWQGDPTTMMTTDEYEELRKEWKQAGSPKSRNPLPMAR
jgi:hypothetical protein